MKFFTLIFALLLSSQAFAHHPHLMSSDAMHSIYHAIFWILCGVVVVKAVSYFKAKRKQK
ncbi:hypothetical protein GCM10007916_18410 [Psychromonas marina]|uniref:Uncharacterized protein n=1 Tax=Psychromonas marina TaxID=88364 RepID=A0ABQ6E0J3_9GAMM|nr:hypothetical protein [Psychromonas marina]GLS90774.1 hypothetical protein GCM10007916_18410 [Psychromonas marina]